MAITLLSQPEAYTPAFSPAWWTASSNQTSQVNFKYTVVFTDLLTSASITKQYDQRPADNKLVFDSNIFAALYTKNYIPNNDYGWQVCTDAIRQIRVNIGETYGTTPTYYAGSDVDYIVWNGVLSDEEYPNYAVNDFVYDSTINNFVYLTKLKNPSGSTFYKPDGKSFTDKSYFIYALTKSNTDCEFFRVNTYNSAGALIGTSDINNPYTSSANYYEKYLCIDVGIKGLTEISSGLVTGTYPIITSSVAYYDIIDGYYTPTPTARQNIIRIYVGCEAKYEVYSAQYLTTCGSFETLNLPKVSSINNQTVKTSYKKTPYSLNASNVYTYTTFTNQEITLTATTQARLTLQTDWLTYEEVEAHEQVIDAPYIYLDYGSTTGLIPVSMETQTYNVIKRWNTQDPYFQITVRKNGVTNRQRG